MSLEYFRCPDGIKRTIKECLEQCPRPEGRCLALPYLYEIGNPRIWRGTPSTTQLLNPTRLAYLQITSPYSLDPMESAFMVLGSRHHKTLEIVATKIKGLIAEKKLDKTEASQNTGILDLLEPDENQEGFYKLIDYKTWGAFSVAKILGRSDKNGDYEYQQISLQLNNYRIKAEQLGFPISKLLVQCTVRDGGTSAAYKNRVPEKILFIPIDIMDTETVLHYFFTKTKALLAALETETLPELCPYEERWSGRRCKNYCDVAEFCPEGAKVNNVSYLGA